MPAGYAANFLTGPLRAQVMPTRTTAWTFDAANVDAFENLYVELGMTAEGWEYTEDQRTEEITTDWYGDGTVIDHVHLGSTRMLRGVLLEANRTVVRDLLYLHTRDAGSMSAAATGIYQGDAPHYNQDGNIGCLLSTYGTFCMRFLPMTKCQAQEYTVFPVCLFSPRFRRTFPRVQGLTRVPIEIQALPFYVNAAGDYSKGEFFSSKPTTVHISDTDELNRLTYYVTYSPAA